MRSMSKPDNPKYATPAEEWTIVVEPEEVVFVTVVVVVGMDDLHDVWRHHAAVHARTARDSRVAGGERVHLV